MRARTLGSVFVVLVLVACSGGGDTSDTSSGSSSSSSSSSSTSSSSSSGGATSDFRAPGSSCIRSVDAGTTSYSSGLCADNPALAGCRLCLEIPDADAGDNHLCVYACRVGTAGDCPAGQTCQPPPGGSRDSSGTCRNFGSPSALGYCR